MIERSRIGLNRIIYPKIGLEEFFKFTKDLGLNKIELRNDLPGGKIIDDYNPEEIKRLSEKYGVELLSINALQKFNLGLILSETMKELKKIIDLSLTIDCKAIVLCPNNDIDDKRSPDEIFKETVASLKAFGPLFQDSGIEGYLEPLGFKECSLRSLTTAMKAIQESGFSVYKTVHDSFHHHIGPDTFDIIENDYDISYTGLVHISGAECDLPINEYRDNHRLLINKQDRLQAKEQVELLLKLGYGGNISFEPFSKSVQEMESESLKSAIDGSIEYISS
ncbi:MAG: TIM barrel protein [Candidatus Caldatribacteriota bacterium]|nr:TIM barrel protein [Candidatus Caldatribacteriota bacterium]